MLSTVERVLLAFERLDFLGWHDCGRIDAPNLIPRKASRQYSGLLDGYRERYPRIENVLKECVDDLC